MKHIRLYEEFINENSNIKPVDVEEIASTEYYVLRDYRSSIVGPTRDEDEKITGFFKMLDPNGVSWDRYKFNGVGDPCRYDYKPVEVKKYHPITVEKMEDGLWAAKGFYHDIIYLKSESLDSLIGEMSIILTPDIEWAEIR